MKIVKWATSFLDFSAHKSIRKIDFFVFESWRSKFKWESHHDIRSKMISKILLAKAHWFLHTR